MLSASPIQKTNAQNIGKSHQRHGIADGFADMSGDVGTLFINYVLLACVFAKCSLPHRSRQVKPSRRTGRSYDLSHPEILSFATRFDRIAALYLRHQHECVIKMIAWVSRAIGGNDMRRY